MTTTVHLITGGAADARIADALSDAIPPYGRRARTPLTVRREGDVATADWVILLASPESAADPEVAHALERRIATAGVDRLLVVVTAGGWVWDAGRGALDPERSTAASPAVRDAFPSEPRHLEYHGGRERRPSPRDPVFAEHIAEIVAPIIGTTKDDIFGEEVRLQQRTRRRTRLTAVGLAALLVVAALGGVFAVQAAAAAERARAEAVIARDDADSRRLAALSETVAGEDGALARLLAVQAWRIAPTAEAEHAMESAAQTSGAWEVTTTADDVRRLIGHGGRVVDAALSTSHVATLDAYSAVRIWPIDDAASPVETGSPRGSIAIAWSADETTLASASGNRVELFDPDGAALGFVGLGDVARDVAPWGETGFVAGGGSVALIADGAVAAERSAADLDLAGTLVFVGASDDGSRVVVGTDIGEVLTLDDGLAVVDAWTWTAAADQFGERDMSEVLAWDGQDQVVLPPDNAQVLGPVWVGGNPDPGDGAIAGVFGRADGVAVASISGGYMPLPASSALFLPDGRALAITPGGLESPPALATTDPEWDVSTVPLPNAADLIATSPDGVWLLIGGDDETAHLLQIGTPAVEASDGAADMRACAAAGRNMSEQEWGVYLPDRPYEATCPGFDAPYAPADG